MNTFENIFCSSSLWRYVSRNRILPWLLSNATLGDHVLEVGAGYGAATSDLNRRAARVTSLEYSARSFPALKTKISPTSGAAVQGDASALPFADQTFSAATAILVLHHLLSTSLQDRAFSEIFRVLRPGGVFLVFEINDSWIHHVGHVGSTFTPLIPASAFARLSRTGFSPISVDFRTGAFRIIATRQKP